MPNEYDNCMLAIKDVQYNGKRCLAFDDAELDEETVEKLEADKYTVRSFTVRPRDGKPFRRTVIAWSKR